MKEITITQEQLPDDYRKLLSNREDVREIIFAGEVDALGLNRFDTPELDVYFIDNNNRLLKAVYERGTHREIRTERIFHPFLEAMKVAGVELFCTSFASAFIYSGIKSMDEPKAAAIGIGGGICLLLINLATTPVIIQDYKNNKEAWRKYKDFMKTYKTY